MVLVDTSVLIDFLKGRSNPVIEKFQFILASGITFGINSLIYQEVLQGARNEKEFETLKSYLETQRFYDLKNGKDSYAKAANIYFLCRKNGFQVGSTIDCLIAQSTIEHNLLLLHNDKDFEKIAKVVKLRFY